MNRVWMYSDYRAALCTTPGSASLGHKVTTSVVYVRSHSTNMKEFENQCSTKTIGKPFVKWVAFESLSTRVWSASVRISKGEIN